MDKSVKTTELIIKALEHAQSNKLDITIKADVKKILEFLDPLHTSDKEVEEFMKLLQDADTFLEMTSKPKKTNLPN